MPGIRAVARRARCADSACYVSDDSVAGPRFAVGAALGWSRHDRGHTGDNMTLTDVAEATADRRDAVTTVASLARGWAQRSPKQVSMREKDFGIWREYTWEQTWELIEDAAHGLLALGVEPGRSRLDPLRGPSGVDHPRPGDRRRAGHHGRAVPDQPDGGGRVPARRLWRQDPPRRGPGTGRQGVPDRPTADPRPAADHLRRAAGPRRRRRRSAPVLGELPGARSRAQARSTPTRSPPRWRGPRTTT